MSGVHRGPTPSSWVDMNSMEVGRHLMMRKAIVAQGLELKGAKIGGLVDMESIEVGASIIMREAGFSKPVRLLFAKIGSNVDLSGAKLPEIDLTGTRIAGELRLGRKLDTDPESSDGLFGWPKKLELNGLNYTRLVGFDAVSEAIKNKGQTEWFLDWLIRDTNDNQQSYEHLAGVLRKAGKYDMADDILYAGRERERAGAAGLRWWGLTLLNYLIGYGYGYRYFYSLLWVIGLVALGVIVLRLTGEHRKHSIPLGVAYSLDMLLPIVQLREFHYVKVDLSGPARHYFYFHKLMGYVLASFLIAGLSGLTR